MLVYILIPIFVSILVLMFMSVCIPLRDNNEVVVIAIRCDHTDCSVSDDYIMVLSFLLSDSQWSICQHEDRHITKHLSVEETK
jgi:hypothetical protein